MKRQTLQHAVRLDLREKGRPAADDGDVEGTGWRVGPYVSYAMSEKLFLDVRAMLERSENSAAQDVLGSRYQGGFDTERWPAWPACIKWGL